MKSLLVLTFLVTGMVEMNAESTTHFPTNEELRSMRALYDPILSPDGKSALVTIQDSTADSGRTHIWFLDIDGGSQRLLSWPHLSLTSESDPEFLHNGKSMLFMAGSQLWRGQLDGSEATQIKLSEADEHDNSAVAPEVDSYKLSPNGKVIAVVASEGTPREVSQQRSERRDVIWVDHDPARNHVYLVDTTTWRGLRVPALTDVDAVSWSTASDQLLVLTHTRPEYAGFSEAGWIVPIDNPASQTRLKGIPHSTRRAAWLHNGKELILLAQSQEDAPIGTSDLYLFEMTNGTLRHLDTCVKECTLSPRTLLVESNDRAAVVSLTRGVRRAVGRVSLSTGKLEILDLQFPVISDFSQQPGEKSRWIYVGSSSTSPPALYVSDAIPGSVKRVSHPDVAPPHLQSATSKTVNWKRAGVQLEGLFYLPPGARGKFPLVVIAHGGPPGQFTDSYVGLTNLLVGKGWAVFLPNPRGSTGYGISFEALNKGDLGGGDFLDVMSGIDQLIRTESIDPNRLALIGHSYGGSLAAFAAGKTNRFKAVVCSAPVTDEISEQGTEEDPSYPDAWFTGSPWIHFQDAWRQSPLAYAKSVSSPVLLLHGMNDTSVPSGQSYEFYRALRDRGVYVELLLFPRENHGSMRHNFLGEPSSEPWHGLMARDHMLTFIARAFNGDFGKEKEQNRNTH